jgi:hypothetical protein
MEQCWLSWICGGLKTDVWYALKIVWTKLRSAAMWCGQAEKHCFNIWRMKGISWMRFQASSVVQLSSFLYWDATWHRLVAGYWHCPDLWVTRYQSTLHNIPEQRRTKCHGHYKKRSRLQNFLLSKEMPSTKTRQSFWQIRLYTTFTSGIHTVFTAWLWTVPISRKVHMMLRSKFSIIYHVIHEYYEWNGAI